MSDESSSDETILCLFTDLTRDQIVQFGELYIFLYNSTSWIAVLNKFMQELDQRFLDTQKEKKSHTPERKVRISGSLLASFPPPKQILAQGYL